MELTPVPLEFSDDCTVDAPALRRVGHLAELPGDLQVRFATLYLNHWYVTTASGIAYTCWDEQVVSLCIYALRHDPPVLDRFPDGFIHGYYMRELSTFEREEILAQ